LLFGNELELRSSMIWPIAITIFIIRLRRDRLFVLIYDFVGRFPVRDR
jgi:hypothetical protein